MRRQQNFGLVLGAVLILVGILILAQYLFAIADVDVMIYIIAMIFGTVLLVRNRRRYWWSGFVTIAGGILLISRLAGIEAIYVVVSMFVLNGGYLVALSLSTRKPSRKLMN